MAVKKVKSGYKVTTSEGKKIKTFPTKKQAVAQSTAIYLNQHGLSKKKK